MRLDSRIENQELFARLVKEIGGARKASFFIKELRGAAPSKSAIDRAVRGEASNDYQLLNMIRDLEVILR